MNWDRIEGNWNEFKGKIQQQWGKLTPGSAQSERSRGGELRCRFSSQPNDETGAS